MYNLRMVPNFTVIKRIKYEFVGAASLYLYDFDLSACTGKDIFSTIAV